jgi:hypothetical protein
MSEPVASLKNPWLSLPTESPFILPQDAAVLDRFPTEKAKLRFDALPIPYFGDPRRADVVLLTLNPAIAAEGIVAETPKETAEHRASLTFESEPLFYPLNAEISQPYWTQRLGRLLEKLDPQVVAEHLACVEFFPYWSRTFDQLPLPVPSQFFGFRLVEEAATSGKLIVVLRGLKLWGLAVSNLLTAPIIVAKNPRTGAVSPGNLGSDAFDRVVRRLQAPRGQTGRPA